MASHNMSSTKNDLIAPKWWEKSIVKRSTSSIDRMVDTMMLDSHFLRRTESDLSAATPDSILSLNRSNVQAGALLGKGSFSVVLEVTALVEDREEGAYDESDGVFSSSTSSLLDRQCLQDIAKQGRYAIKHLRPDLIQTNSADYFQDAAADLIMEARYLGALDHAGILRLRGIANGGVSAYEESGDYDAFFLVTDRLDGTLKDRILEYQSVQQEESLLDCFRPGQGQAKEEPRTAQVMRSHNKRVVAEKIDIALQLASALRYLHEQNLIFRDLKPQNVGLVGNTVQLFDFGFCREMPSASSSYSSVASGGSDSTDSEDDAVYYMSGKGSLMYLAPEVLGSGRYNQKVDCYSFAMVLYELLTLNKPFHCAPNLNVFRELICKHKARPSLEFSDTPMAVQDLLQDAWDDSVPDRLTMRQICERLEDIAGEFTAVGPEDLEEHSPGSTKEQQLWLTSSASNGGGAVLNLLTGFAHNVRRGYDVLARGGGAKLTSQDQPEQGNTFQSSPIDSLGSTKYDSMLLDYDLSCPTAETEDCTPASSFSFGLHLSPCFATEEPLEVTLEQTMCMSFDCEDDDADDGVSEKEHRMDDEVDGGDMEMRCPPSPPKRTISAPLNHMATKLTAASMVPCPPISRRQSCTGVGMLPESHWSPPAVARAC